MTEKFNKCKKNSRKIVTILLVSLLLTGCETDISVFDNYEIPLSQSSEQDISEGTTADNIDSEFLSADICVVPKKKQLQKDSFMTAGASLIFDNTHNKMLYADNIYTKMYPASTTKIVTNQNSVSPKNFGFKVFNKVRRTNTKTSVIQIGKSGNQKLI